MTTPTGGRRGRRRERDGTVTEDGADVLTSYALKLAIIERPARAWFRGHHRLAIGPKRTADAGDRLGPHLSAD